MDPLRLRRIPPNGKNRNLGEEIARICEGVKQILLLRGNKKNIFHPCWGENVLHTFTNWFLVDFWRMVICKNGQKMRFFGQKVPFVKNCELYIYTVYYY
jgi:hypothetical protein